MCSYHVIVVCLLFQLILGEQFYFQHCENAIQTNHRKEPIIALWCRSNKKYKYCSVGNVIGNEQELSNSCKFQSTNYFSRNGPMFLKNMECDPKSFILDIWYEGIKQTDFDCIVQVNPSHNKGEKLSLKLNASATMISNKTLHSFRKHYQTDIIGRLKAYL